jgi:hypothetical protein
LIASVTTRTWRDILTLARREKLTTYDATYLEPAVRWDLPLLTRNNELRAAVWAPPFFRDCRRASPELSVRLGLMCRTRFDQQTAASFGFSSSPRERRTQK